MHFPPTFLTCAYVVDSLSPPDPTKEPALGSRDFSIPSDMLEMPEIRLPIRAIKGEVSTVIAAYSIWALDHYVETKLENMI